MRAVLRQPGLKRGQAILPNRVSANRNNIQQARRNVRGPNAVRNGEMGVVMNLDPAVDTVFTHGVPNGYAINFG